MPKNVVYESLTEAQDYADRVNGQPVEVEGGYTVMNPLGYAGGGSGTSPKNPTDNKPKEPSPEDLTKKTVEGMFGAVGLKPPKGFTGTF